MIVAAEAKVAAVMGTHGCDNFPGGYCRLSHYQTLERQVIHTALLSSAGPNAYIIHALNLYSFFPHNPARFYVVPMRRKLN